MKAKHMLLMLACCLIPIAGLAAVVIFHLPFTGVLTALMVVACPLGHGLMMYFMMRGHHDEHGRSEHEPVLPAAAAPLLAEPRDSR